jgi:hypothetical protein
MALVAGSLATPAIAQSDKGVSGIYGDRYCEIITARKKMLKVTLTVYNTIVLCDCPDEAWKAIDAQALAKELGVTRVNKNGPRYWTIDGIVGRGVSTNGERATFGGIAMDERATLEMSLSAALDRKKYSPVEVKRDTIFVFKAGNPVFELTDPDGQVYMMQSYAQIVDPTLSLADLPGLASRLKLPKGWTFSTRTLDKEYRLEADGLAFVLQDELENSYQRRPK